MSAEVPLSNAPVADAPFPEFVAAGTDGTDFLVAWFAQHPNDSAGELIASRVSAAGQVLDPTGILLDYGSAQASPINGFGLPAVHFDGLNYWVLHGGQGVAAAEVSPAGVPGPVMALPATAPGPCFSPVTAQGSGQWLVAWSDHASGIFAIRVSASGSSMDPSPIAVDSAAGNRHGVAAAFDGTNYWLVWAEGVTPTGGPVLGKRVSPSGAVLDATPVTVSALAGVHEYPSTSCLGPNCLVAWCDSANGYQAAFAVVANGMVIHSGVAPRIATDDFCSLAFAGNDGANFFLTWSTGDFPLPVGGVHVSTTGQVAELAPLALTPPTDGGIIGSVDYGALFASDEFLLAWADLSSVNGQIRIHASLLTDAGVPVSTSPISQAVPDRMFPSVAANGTDYLVSWWSDVAGSGLAAAWVPADGGAPAPVAGLPSDPDFNQWGFPQAASDGVNFQLSAATNDAGLVTQRVSAGGTLIDARPVTFARAMAATPVPCAWTASAFACAWGEALVPTPEVFAASVPSPTPPSAVTGSGGVSDSPAVSGFGAGYWIAWPSDAGVLASRAMPAPGQYDPIPLLALPGAVGEPALAFDGSRTLLVAKGAAGGVWITLLSADGTATPAAALAPDPALQVAVAASDGEFLVLWEAVGDGGTSLLGARVFADGGFEAPGFAVTALNPTSLLVSRIAAASTGGGRYAVAYDRFDATADAFSPFLRTVETSPVSGDGGAGTPVAFRVGCGCATTPLAPWALLLPLVLRTKRRGPLRL